MKIQNLVAVAAIALTASTAFAQTHPSAPGIASSTVSGLFVPTPSGSSVQNVGGALALPPSTPVRPAVGVQPSQPAAQASVNAVAAGSPAAVASFTQTLSTAGIPAAAAQGIATALQTLGSSPTVGSLNAAMSSWNAAIQSLTPTQVVALMQTPAGFAAARTMIANYLGATAR